METPVDQEIMQNLTILVALVFPIISLVIATVITIFVLRIGIMDKTERVNLILITVTFPILLFMHILDLTRMKIQLLIIKTKMYLT